MDRDEPDSQIGINSVPVGKANETANKAKTKARTRRPDGVEDGVKRRCVSTACIACRKRKSKCDGNTPACAACASVYRTECLYDPNSDHRRKGVYKSDVDSLKTRTPTLQTLIHAIITLPEDEAFGLVHQIRTTNNLEDVAQKLQRKDDSTEREYGSDDISPSPNSHPIEPHPAFEMHLSGKMGELRLEDGSTRYIGGTSNLIFLGNGADNRDRPRSKGGEYEQRPADAIISWTNVTQDPELIMHLLNMYFTWHYTYFTTLSRDLFYRDFLLGNPSVEDSRMTKYCSSLLVNAMLALGCHFTAHPGSREKPEDSATAGDHFFKEAKRLLMANDEHEKPRLTTVQALALMSVREAGCGREAKGWVYSGMSFRMACDLGLNLDSGALSPNGDASRREDEEDARRITFWGCFLFDKCWSNYLGRLPQLPRSIVTVPKFDVFPDEEAAPWSPYTDSGFIEVRAQPSRTRAVALQISSLCEISSDLMNAFYNPIDMDKSKGKHAELKKLSELHQRLETWRRNLPNELEPREGALPNVLVMHMFFQILYIHLFRPFLKYNQATSPLPANVSPRKLCTGAAAMISKLLRLYKRSHGLRQVCNIAVYIAHCACTIHLLNLPEKNARRDIIHGFKHLEEIAECWLCARRTLAILKILAEKWQVELPQEAAIILQRTSAKFGPFSEDLNSPRSSASPMPVMQQMKPHNPDQAMHKPKELETAALNAGGPLSAAPTSASTGVRPASSATHSLPPQTTADASFYPAYQHSMQTMSPTDARPAQGQVATSISGPSRQSRMAPNPATDAVRGSLPVSSAPVLPRDPQEWWLRDQSQFATGFENWEVLDSPANQQPAWLNNAGMPAQRQHTIDGDGNGAVATSLGHTIGSAGTSGAPAVVNQWQSAGLHGYGRINGYDEDSWYQ